MAKSAIMPLETNCCWQNSRTRTAYWSGGISLGMVSTHRLASWEFHCFSTASAAFHKVLRSAYSGGAFAGSRISLWTIPRYLAFLGSASLLGRIHRTAFRRSGRQRRQPQTAVGYAEQSRFRCVDRAFRIPPFYAWWMGWRFTTSFWAEKKQETFFRFPARCAAV